EEGRGVGMGAALEDAVEHLGTGGLGERSELAQADLRLLGIAGGVQAGEDHALQAQLAVLDLADVLELGGEPGDAAQRLSVGEVELLPVRVGGDRKSVV